MIAQRKIHFLLVEDSPYMAARLESMLRGADNDKGTDITIVQTVDDAVRELESGQYDVCFLEHHIGGRDGREVLKRIPVASILTAIIFLTDKADRAIAFETLKLGVDDLLLNARFDQFELEKSIAYAMYRKFKQVELQKSTLKDALTGIGNRILFQEQLKTAIARAQRDGERVGVLYLDIDGFKPVNDTFGHSTGDKLLQAISERLVERTRSSDVVARIGGDEFAAVLIKLDDRSTLNRLAQNMETAISGAPYLIDEHTIKIGASVGAALFPDDGSDMDALIRLADKNMYVQKMQRQGKVIGKGERELRWQ